MNGRRIPAISGKSAAVFLWTQSGQKMRNGRYTVPQDSQSGASHRVPNMDDSINRLFTNNRDGEIDALSNILTEADLS